MSLLSLLPVLLLGHAAATVSAFEQKPMPSTHLRNRDDTARPSCRCFPGDECWPSDAEWSSLNATVDGRLIATVPLGSPCHDPYYDEEQCAYLRSQWLYAGVQQVNRETVPLATKRTSDELLQRKLKLQRDGPVLRQPELRPVDPS